MGAAVGLQAAPGGDVLRHRARGGDVLPRGGLGGGRQDQGVLAGEPRAGLLHPERQWQTRKTGKKDPKGRDIRKTVGKPTKEVVYHVSSLDPDSRTAEKFAEIVRTHWYVEAYHGTRDNGYHEDAFTRRCDENVMAAMMVARSFVMWTCARHPERTTEQVKNDLYLHPAKLVRIMMKGGLQ